MREWGNRLKNVARTALTAVCALPVLLCDYSVASAVSEMSWQNYSRLAHQLVNERNYTQAVEYYQKAIDAVKKAQESEAIELDLQLNKAETLIMAKKLNDATSLLSDIRQRVVKLKDPMIEIRYWRRQRALAEARELGTETALLEIKLLQLTERHFGRDHSIYCSQLRVATLASLNASLWDESLKLAYRLKDFNKTCTRSDWRKLASLSLREFYYRSRKITDRCIEKGDLASVAKVLEDFEEYEPNAPVVVRAWSDLLWFAFRDNNVAMQNRCIAHLAQMQQRLGKEDHASALIIAGALVEGATKDVYNESVKDETEARLATAVKLLERMWKPEALRKILTYDHAKSLYALALAKRSKLNEAQEELNELRLSPHDFPKATDYNGVVQARFEIAAKYISAGNNESARRQIDLLFALLDSLPATTQNKASIDALHIDARNRFKSLNL